MSELEELFGFAPKNKKSILSNLHKKPEKDTGNNAPTFQQISANIVQQADLLFMPSDNGFRYILVVVDVGSRKTDAAPLKSKESTEVLDGFKTIYKRKILKLPKQIQVDPGSEFKSVVKDWFKKQHVFVRVGKAGRHRQQALVERKNQAIGTALFRRMAAQELLTSETSREWVSDLPTLITLMNKRVAKQKLPKQNSDPTCSGKSCDLLDIGTKVRVILEQPHDYVTGKKLPGRFRATDMRWDPRVRTIAEVLLRPGSPPLYLLNGDVGKRN